MLTRVGRGASIQRGMSAEGEHTMVEFVSALVGLYLPEEREGQGLVEYALIIVLVSIAVIALLTLLGSQIGTVFTRITSSLA